MKYERKRNNWNKENITIPITKIVTRGDINSSKIVIEDSNKKYKLPSVLQENRHLILSAHNTSNIFNSVVVRLDNISIKNKILTLQTSRTTYFDSMVTNRAADYQWEPIITVRELFEPGYQLNKLKESKLSNHIGVNVIIETHEPNNDSYIAFIHRSGINTISKNMLGLGVSAVLKGKYLFKSIEFQGSESVSYYEDHLTLSGIEYAIEQEIIDELNYGKDAKLDISFKNNFIGIYRDAIEVGKPNFVFHYKINLTKEMLDAQIKKTTSFQKKNSITDGSKFFYVKKNELKDTYLTENRILLGGKLKRISPSAAASIIMYIDELNTSLILCHLNRYC